MEVRWKRSIMGSLCSLSAVECFYFLDTFLTILPKTEPFSFFFFNLKNKKQKVKWLNTVVCFFIFCFNGYCFSVGMRTFTDCARRTCGLECYGYWIFRRLAVFYNADMNLDIMFRMCGRESLCQSKFTNSLSFSKIIPLRTQNMTVQRQSEHFTKGI